MTVIENWNRLHRKVMKFTLLEIYKTGHGLVKTVLGDLALSRGIGLDDLQTSF